MSKFSGPIAEWLYRQNEFDEEVGDSSEGVGWAGMISWQYICGGVILTEDTNGFVELQEFRETALLWQAWAEISEKLDISQPEPEEGDWVVQDTSDGYAASQYGEVITFDGMLGIDPVLHHISERMDKDQFWPNVWHVSDHGNYMLLDLYEMGIRKTP